MGLQSKSSEKQLIESLNNDCHCIAVDKNALRSSLEAHLIDSGLPNQLLDIHAHLFASSPVFIVHDHIQKMEKLIQAVEEVIHNDGYREQVLNDGPDTTKKDYGPRGVFFGYDFHLGSEGPQLIEINTNAGGVLLNYYLSAAQQACCQEIMSLFGKKSSFQDIENQLITMFRAEWQLQFPGEILNTIAIVDNANRKHSSSTPNFCSLNHSSSDMALRQ